MSFEKGKIMNKIYTVFIFVISAFLLSKFFPENTVTNQKNEVVLTKSITGKEEIAIFAGGCFWCMEHPFEDLPGVTQVVSGYIGGKKENATYKKVASGHTRHLEAVKIHFDPEKISYADILEVFWRNINPTDDGGQFVDRGSQYRTGIFYSSETQKEIAEKSKINLIKSGRFKKAIVTPVIEASPFYRAEEYHQDFFKKNVIRYKIYRAGSGRDEFINKIWGKEKEYIYNCVDSTFVSSVGKEINIFENEIKDFTLSEYAVATVNGTSALHTSLMISGVSNDDEVITQSLTFIATSNAIIYCGAVPIFLDVDKDTLSLSPDCLKQFLSSNRFIYILYRYSVNSKFPSITAISIAIL